MFSFLLLGVLYCGNAFSQTEIAGSLNNHNTSVTAVGANYVEVASVTDFAAGDTILLIQMKGVRILTPETSSYGQYQTRTGSPGQHEFLIIQSVLGAPDNRLTFTANLLNTYTPEGIVQVVKVRYFQSARVTGTLHSPEWNSTTGTGGVLALIVGGNLILDADIDMTGKGFEGGGISMGLGECASLDAALRNRYSYDASSAYSGFKGEGVAITNNTLIPINPTFSKGRGANLNSGGGGNGKFSGGGGGSNFGEGGVGELEPGECLDLDASGKGGRPILGTAIETGIFLGGGGGASTYLAGSTASPGARGGGIIIIV
ncbi:MAG: hypothetical protein IH591_14280, partial [Bacteroidales bacterium]|nr:hypothetical protein [Bacteroidales bacterium]